MILTKKEEKKEKWKKLWASNENSIYDIKGANHSSSNRWKFIHGVIQWSCLFRFGSMHLPAILQTLNDAKEGEKLHETQDRKHSIFNLIFEWLLHVHAMLIGYLIAVYFSLSFHCVIIHTSIAIEQWRMEMIANNTNNQFPFGINDEYQMDHISVNWIWWLFDYLLFYYLPLIPFDCIIWISEPRMIINHGKYME